MIASTSNPCGDRPSKRIVLILTDSRCRELFLGCIGRHRAAAPADDVKNRLAVHRRDQLPFFMNGGDEMLPRAAVVRIDPKIFGQMFEFVLGQILKLPQRRRRRCRCLARARGRRLCFRGLRGAAHKLKGKSKKAKVNTSKISLGFLSYRPLTTDLLTTFLPFAFLNASPARARPADDARATAGETRSTKGR